MFVKLIFETVSSNFCKVEKNTKQTKFLVIPWKKKIAEKNLCSVPYRWWRLFEIEVAPTLMVILVLCEESIFVHGRRWLKISFTFLGNSWRFLLPVTLSLTKFEAKNQLTRMVFQSAVPRFFLGDPLLYSSSDLLFSEPHFNQWPYPQMEAKRWLVCWK